MGGGETSIFKMNVHCRWLLEMRIKCFLSAENSEDAEGQKKKDGGVQRRIKRCHHSNTFILRCITTLIILTSIRFPPTGPFPIINQSNSPRHVGFTGLVT